MNRDRAETIALQALAWVAADDELSTQFASATGASLSDARDRVQDPVFLSSVLEFLTMEDRWIKRFCDDQDLRYEEPMQALMSLPGNMRPEWP